MAEYIKREDVLRRRRKMSGADFGGEFWDEAVLCEDIRKIPTADVAEVVRCKDCKYGEIDDADFPDQYLCHHSGDNWNNGNHFCAFGTPKERGGEK